MSMSAFEETYPDYSAPRALHARRNGAIAASAIGGAAVVILALTSLFAKPGVAPTPAAPESPQAASQDTPSQTQAPAPAAPKITLRSTSASPAAKSGSFDLAAPEFAKLKRDFSSSPRELGGRDDVLTLGEFGGRGPYVRIALQQAEGEKLRSDFSLDMSRLAVQAGVGVLRVAPPSAIATRFGAFEAADIRLTQGPLEALATKAGAERSCVAFRLIDQKLSVEAAGLACGAAGAPIDKKSLGCILDRIDYAPGGGEQALDQFFARAASEPVAPCPATKVQSNAAKPAPGEARAKAATPRRSTARR